MRQVRHRMVYWALQIFRVVEVEPHLGKSVEIIPPVELRAALCRGQVERLVDVRAHTMDFGGALRQFGHGNSDRSWLKGTEQCLSCLSGDLSCGERASVA